MSTNGWLNPFRELSPSHRREVSRHRRVAHEARQREQRVREAYKELVATPRYAAIREDLAASLEEVLRQLVEQASACAHCAPTALRVKALHEIVAEPLHRALDEARQSRLDDALQTEDAREL